MLKLKDIFNIDLNSKGGGKLYKKIMRKYNIPLKDVKELKQEIVECSSGGDSGIKEYYYRFTDKYLDNNIHETPNKDFSILQTINMFTKIDSIICPIYDNTEIGYNTIGNAELIGDFVINFKIKAKPYFKIIDSNAYIPYGYQDDGTVKCDALLALKGNIKDRISKAQHLFGSAEQLNAFLQEVDDIIQEITKEEYEAMITYKP